MIFLVLETILRKQLHALNKKSKGGMVMSAKRKILEAFLIDDKFLKDRPRCLRLRSQLSFRRALPLRRRRRGPSRTA
jgi:hypothetical protein